MAVLTSRAPARTRRAAGLAVAVILLGAGIAAVVGSPHPALTYAGTALLLAVTAGVILAGLVRLVVERGVVLQAVFGALAVYMLVGLTLGFVIGALATGMSGYYFAQGTDATQSARVYFSFTTLTTTGFGDYTAATRGRPGARGPRDAHRPALPRDRHRDAGGEPPPRAAVTCASSR